MRCYLHLDVWHVDADARCQKVDALFFCRAYDPVVVCFHAFSASMAFWFFPLEK